MVKRTVLRPWRFTLIAALSATVAAANPVELVNSAFEQVDKNGNAAGWTPHPNWHAERAGHNGSGGLVFELAEGAKRRGGQPHQNITLKPGKRYYYSALVKAEGLKTARKTKAQGIGLNLDGWNVSNKWIWGSTSHGLASGTTPDWVKVEGITREVPEGMTRAQIQPYVTGVVCGRALIDNIYLEEYELKYVEGVYSDKYRHEAVEGRVTFNAVLNLDVRQHKLADYAAAFIYRNAAGAQKTVSGEIVSATHARVHLAVADLAVGTNAVECAVSLAGKELGRAQGRFARLREATRRKVYIDEYRRTIVDGKPFFPLGMYFRKVTESNLQHYCQAPFNVLMPYVRPEMNAFDLCSKYKLKLIYNLQGAHRDKDGGLAYVKERINRFKDHPALLAWYTNDEQPLTAIPRLTRRQQWVEEMDKDHPTWSVQDVYTELAHYLPTYDVLGMDPYPIGRKMPINRCIYTMRQSDRDTFASRAVWHVPQAFGWNWLFRPNTAKMICPNRAELENMSWQAIAGGANGLVYYSYHHIVEPRATKNNDDEFTWADMCEIAQNIKRHETVLLSEPGPKVEGIEPMSEDLAVRTWRKGSEIWLLAVNCTTNELTAAFSLSGVKNPVVCAVDLGPAPAVALDGSLSLTLPPIGFTFVKLENVLNHIVHRGWGLEWPENSMTALRQCWRAGFIPEADARISQDGVLFAFHDAKYKDQCITNMPWREIKEINIGAIKGKNWQWQKERPPTWDQIFAEMAQDPTRRIAMDYKGVPNELMLECAKKYGVEKQIWHCSGNIARARDWKRRLPGGRTVVWLHNGSWKPLDFNDAAQYQKRSACIREKFERLAKENFEGADMVEFLVYADMKQKEPFCPESEFIKSACKRIRAAGKLPCMMVWTDGRKEDSYRRLAELGVDTFGTDYPTVLQRFLNCGDNVKMPENVPELLQTSAGKVVTSAKEWEEVRRKEILKMFTEQEFGIRPVERPATLKFTPLGADKTMMDGKALRKRVRISYAGERGESGFDVTCFLPKSANKPVGAFLLICNRDPAENIDHERIHKSTFWPAEEIISRGYAAVTFFNGDVAEDSKTDSFATGVYTCFGPSERERTPTSWATISAWAWGASRVLDWLETIEQIDSKRVAVVGHSRGGKTSLWAAASDERFAMACVNNSGCAGAKLNRADLPESETIAIINNGFPHWFCLNYRAYNNRENELPFDQHELIALLAPRAVCIASASQDNWAGQSGEYLSGLLASPAWELYGRPGLVAPRGFPPVDTPLNSGYVSYHLREGPHVLNEYDWKCYMDAADKWMK